MNVQDHTIVTRIVSRSDQLARQHKHDTIVLEHVLHVCLREESVEDILDKMNVDIDEALENLSKYFTTGILQTGVVSQAQPSVWVQEAIYRAATAASMNERTLTPADLMLAMFEYGDDSYAVNVMNAAGITRLALAEALGVELPATKKSGDANKITSREDADIIIAKYAVDLNAEARESKIDPLIGRAKEVAMIVQTLARRTKSNAMLVGEPGVGKTAIAEGLAKLIVENKVPKVLSDKVVYNLDLTALMAGTRYRGDMEERIKLIVQAFEMVPEAIVFIDEIHTMVGGAQQSNDMSNLLKPALSKGKMRVIGSTTMTEFRRHFEQDRALVRRFKRIDIQEPTIEVAKEIIVGLAPRFEEYHGCKFTPEALEAAVDLSSRYLKGQLPDKAIDLIDNAGAAFRVAESTAETIGVDLIEIEAAKIAQIPTERVSEQETDRLAHLESDMRQAVFGQDAAITALADAIFVSKAGLREDNKPMGSYLFAGPTGVGKTEIARQLSNTLGVELIKFDMSEYMEAHSVSKLIGSPPGYVGFNDGNSGSGTLVNAIDEHEHCILLLDEIEKAHPQVYNLFLQVMDDGKLTSSSGKEVSFRNVILIMTTNAGAFEMSRNGIGFGKKEGGDPSEAINRLFTPEFRNRIDAIVKFDWLSEESIAKVVDKFIGQLAVKAAERKVELVVDDAARKWLAANGYDRSMGARPLGRKIAETIKTPLSRMMAIGALKTGGVAKVTVRDDQIVIDA